METVRTSQQFFSDQLELNLKLEAINQPGTSRTSDIILDCSATETVKLNQDSLRTNKTHHNLSIIKPSTISVNPSESDFISLPENQGLNQVPLTNLSHYAELAPMEITTSNLDLGSSNCISNWQTEMNINTETELEIKSEPVMCDELTQEFSVMKQASVSFTESFPFNFVDIKPNFEFDDCEEENSEKQLQTLENSVMSVKMLDSNSLTCSAIESSRFGNSKNDINIEVESKKIKEILMNGKSSKSVPKVVNSRPDEIQNLKRPYSRNIPM